MTFIEIVHHLILIRWNKSGHLTPPENEALDQAIGRLAPLLTAREVDLIRQQLGPQAL